MQEFKRNCFYQLDAGLDWLNINYANPEDFDIIRSQINNILLSITEVLSVDSLEVEFDKIKRIALIKGSVTVQDDFTKQNATDIIDFITPINLS